jgi:hypothetical protein
MAVWIMMYPNWGADNCIVSTPQKPDKSLILVSLFWAVFSLLFAKIALASENSRVYKALVANTQVECEKKGVANGLPTLKLHTHTEFYLLREVFRQRRRLCGIIM